MSEPYHSPIIDSLKKIAERTFSGDKIPPSKVHAAHIIENHFSKQKYENNGSSSSEKMRSFEFFDRCFSTLIEIGLLPRKLGLYPVKQKILIFILSEIIAIRNFSPINEINNNEEKQKKLFELKNDDSVIGNFYFRLLAQRSNIKCVIPIIEFQEKNNKVEITKLCTFIKDCISKGIKDFCVNSKPNRLCGIVVLPDEFNIECYINNISLKEWVSIGKYVTNRFTIALDEKGSIVSFYPIFPYVYDNPLYDASRISCILEFCKIFDIHDDILKFLPNIPYKGGIPNIDFFDNYEKLLSPFLQLLHMDEYDKTIASLIFSKQINEVSKNILIYLENSKEGNFRIVTDPKMLNIFKQKFIMHFYEALAKMNIDQINLLLFTRLISSFDELYEEFCSSQKKEQDIQKIVFLQEFIKRESSDLLECYNSRERFQDMDLYHFLGIKST